MKEMLLNIRYHLCYPVIVWSHYQFGLENSGELLDDRKKVNFPYIFAAILRRATEIILQQLYGKGYENKNMFKAQEIDKAWERSSNRLYPNSQGTEEKKNTVRLSRFCYNSLSQ